MRSGTTENKTSLNHAILRVRSHARLQQSFGSWSCGTEPQGHDFSRSGRFVPDLTVFQFSPSVLTPRVMQAERTSRNRLRRDNWPCALLHSIASVQQSFTPTPNTPRMHESAIRRRRLSIRPAHPQRSIGKRVDVPHPPCQRPAMVDETLNQFSLTRAAFSAGRRLKSKSLTVIMQNVTLLNPSKEAPHFCVFHL
jgi:hypothetical protein